MDDISTYLNLVCGSEPSDAGLRVAQLLDEWKGLHHFQERTLKKVNWSHDRCFTLKADRYGGCGCLATFDFFDLTTLVFLAHDHCIRVEIEPCNFTCLTITFHPRPGRMGTIDQRHPGLQGAVDAWRVSHPEKIASH
jgi:hypothetical protein